MRRFCPILVILLSFFVFFWALNGPVLAAQGYKTTPTTKPDGSKWRIAYIQGGDYKDYLPVMTAVVRGLGDLGWLDVTDLPDFTEEEGAQKLWEWLSAPDRSKYLDFAADAYYTEDWDVDLRNIIKAKLIRRANEEKDIDLIFALGTWAGQDVATNELSTPTLVFSSSDPLASKIVKSIEDSGYDHLWARLDPTRFERQIDIFHDIIGFKKLGIVYENTLAGRSYCSVDVIEKKAKELGFELVPCFAEFSTVHKGQASRNVVACHKELAPKIDAMYITHHRGIQPRYMARLMEPLIENKIPSFSQAGSDEVRYGALLSISQANFRYVGAFYAETIAKVLNGAKPRDLPQVFESPPQIAINLETAEKIGYDPPVDILGAADEIYEETEAFQGPEEEEE